MKQPYVVPVTNTNDPRRPDFRARFTWGIDGSILWLKDEGTECRSLTNDLENCLVELSGDLPAGTQLTHYHIIYRDSEGTWDAIAITALGDVVPERERLQALNKRRVAYEVQHLKFRLFPINQESYEAAVTSVVRNRMYRHFHLPLPQHHNLN